MLAIACFFRPAIRTAARFTGLSVPDLALAVAPALLLAAAAKLDLDSAALLGVPGIWIISILAAGIVLSSALRPFRFGLAIMSIGIAALFFQRSRATIYTDRSFFGIYRVSRAVGPATVLYHGTTIHGAQLWDSAHMLTPVTYYHPSGPVGQVFTSLAPTLDKRSIGVVGLGTGSILCYSKPGQRWTFFEIDSRVEKIARDQRFFTFLSDCEVKPRIVLGDARLTLAREPRGTYSLLIVDAFSSDAIPVHLMTREALRLYEQLLDERGVLMLHISNRRLDLEPVVGDLARDAGLFALIRNHDVASTRQDKEYDYGSDWVVLARQREHLGPLASDTRWRQLSSSGRRKPWTDDYSNLFSVIRW